MEPIETSLTILKAVKLLYDGAKHISNRFLIKKIEAFGKDPHSEPAKEFLSSLSVEKFEELQDLLMHNLNSAESVVKAQYLRKLMNSLCEGRINWLQFGKMSFILNQIYTFDVEKIAEIYYGVSSKVNKSDKERFFTLGLLNHRNKHLWGNDIVTRKDLKEMETEYDKNDLGQLFVDSILFEEKNRIAKQYTEETQKYWDNYSKFFESLANIKETES